jgi:light-regulated signal transduction histidine kinase (bacteriophytochrome)
MGVGMDLAGRRRDGSEFPVEIGLSYVNTPDGPLAFGLVSDITERKKIADELSRANSDLLRSNAALEEFAHLASHDLQEPLRMVTGYLQLLERRYIANLNEEALEFIHYASDGASRMKTLIQDLLNFSRAGSTASFSNQSAEVMLQNATANLRAAIAESDTEITSDPLPSIWADPGLITQVFQNLIANAIKFRRDSEPQIHISCEERGSEYIFSVHDNGIGIEPQHLDRIFRMFERLHSAERYAGSGIGLAITRKIVERHGGKVWVESQSGVGSTFYFSLSSEKAISQQAAKA